MKQYTKRPWSHEERVLLSETYRGSDRDRLETLFPDRSYNACVKQAKYLRDRGWVFKRNNNAQK
jgi:hypothetical protein